METLKKSDTDCEKLISIVDAKDQRQGRRHLREILVAQDLKLEELLKQNREQLIFEQQNWRQTDEERQCHQVLRTSEYERYKSRNPDRVKGTCEWFLAHSNFKQWLGSQDANLLWVSADPGCGKSVLSKSLIDNELNCTALRSTCYYFFKDDNPDQRSLAKALCALLHQLFSLKPELIKHALKEFRHNDKGMCESPALLWRILMRAAADSEADEIVCVVDALDECEEVQRLIFIEHLNQTFGDPSNHNGNGTRLKFLVTSRPYFDIERHFRPLTSAFPSVRLSGEEESESISREIEEVIKVKVSEIGRTLDLAISVQMSLQKKLLSVANRTYLWLKLIFDVILNQLQVTEKRLLAAINTLPDTVDKAYTAILDKSNDRPRAKKLLHLIVAAWRPLSLREMNIALAVEQESKSYEDLDLEPEGSFRVTVRNLCGLFVNIIDSRIFLIHQTAREFLVCEATPVDLSGLSRGDWKHSLCPADSNLIMANACISYLLLDVFNIDPSIWDEEAAPFEDHFQLRGDAATPGVAADDPGTIAGAGTKGMFRGDSELFGTYGGHPLSAKWMTPEIYRDTYRRYAYVHGFLAYSATEWISHYERADFKGRTTISKSALRICDPLSKRFHAWFFAWTAQWRRIDTAHWAEYYRTTLTVASSIGLEDLVRLLLEEGVDVNEESRATHDGKRTTALSIAASRLDINVTNLLLENGASLNSLDEQGKPVLFHTIRVANKAMVAACRRLCQTIWDKFEAKALRDASIIWRQAMVRLLLEETINKQNRSGSEETIISKASPHTYWSSTRLLLKLSMDSIMKQALSRVKASCMANLDRQLELLYAKLEEDYMFLSSMGVCLLLLKYGADPEVLIEFNPRFKICTDDYRGLYAFFLDDEVR